MAIRRFHDVDQLTMNSGFLIYRVGPIFRFWQGAVRLILVAALLASATPPGRAQLLSEREAYDEIVRAVSEQLSKPDRLTRLPHNIADLSVAPDRKPIFTILIGSKSEDFNALQRKEAYLKDQGTFLISRFGAVVASYEDQVVLQGQVNGLQHNPIVICGPSAVRGLDFPAPISINRVFHAGSDWGFVFSDGYRTSIKLDSSTNFQTVVSNRAFAPWVAETRTGAILVTRPDESTGYDPNSHLSITVKDQRGLKQSLFKGYQRVGSQLQGLLPLNDGRFLVVSEKLVVLREDEPTEPTDAEMASLLKASEKQDHDQFNEALRAISIYPREQLGVLDRLLAASKDPLEPFQSVERATRYLLESMDRTQTQIKAATNREQLVTTFNSYRQTATEFLQRIEQERNGPLGITLVRAVQLMRNGWQFFDGRWVQRPQLIQQDGAVAILLELEFLNAARKATRGVFRLDPAGRLELLFQHERDSFTPPCQFFRTPSGDQLMFFPFEGLARYRAGTFEWLDQSDEMKSLERVVGCDGEGRIYFGSVSSKISVSQVESVHRAPSGYDIWSTPRRGSPDFWVYRPAAKPANCPIVRLFPVEHTPVMDSSNRIWFCPTIAPEFAVPSAAGTLMSSRPAQLGRAELAAATQGLTNVTVSSRPAPRIFGAAEISAHLDLFCYEQGRVSHCLTNLPLGTVLLASEAGGVIGTTQDRLDRGAFVVQDPESATVAGDLHELATKSFALMTNVAPRQSDPLGFVFLSHVIHLTDYCPSLCLVGDRLWINDHDKVEVYQDGKPTGYQMKLTIPSRKLCLFGPVTNSIGDQRMLIFAPAISEGSSSTARASLVWSAASVPANCSVWTM